jgi:hypothetical protein
MLLYNVTVGIDQESEEEWLRYMKDIHIKAVMDTGMFESHKMYKVLHDSEDGTISYSIQYFAKSINHIQQYLEQFAPALVKEHREKFINRHVTFMTLLEEVPD